LKRLGFGIVEFIPTPFVYRASSKGVFRFYGHLATAQPKFLSVVGNLIRLLSGGQILIREFIPEKEGTA
jgi:hypothetical protein